jgi:hypothetical protein
MGLWLHHVGDEGTGEVALEVKVHHSQKNLKLLPVHIEKCFERNGCEGMRRNVNNWRQMPMLRNKLLQGPTILNI